VDGDFVGDADRLELRYEPATLEVFMP
jgi:hypothetical protein